MLDMERMLKAGVEFAGTSRVVLAAPYELSDQMCCDFAGRGLIAAYVANGAPATAGVVNPLIAGHWIDREHVRWRLARGGTPVLLFLGSPQQVGGRMLLAAQWAGIRRIVVVHVDGSITADFNVTRALMSRLKAALVNRLLTSKLGSSRGQNPVNWVVDRSFEHAYGMLYRLFRGPLQLPPHSFVPRRLLIICGSLGPGGAERQVAYTAAGIMRSGRYEVYLACNSLDPPSDFFRAYVEAAGVKLVTVPTDAPEFRTPEVAALREQLVPYDSIGLQNLAYAVFHYAMLIRSIRPDVVHTWMDYCNVLGGVAADLVGVPALVQGGRSVAPDHFSIFQPYMRPGYLTLLKRRKTIILNNSRAGADDYARWLGMSPERIRVIANGFEFPHADLSELRRDERQRLGIPADSFVVGSIIRFAEEKRPKLLLDVAGVLLRRHTGLHVVIFGEGPLLEEMRSCVQKSVLSDRVKLPGLTKDAWASLSAMDVFLLTSRMEGLPNVVIEAQAAGVPVVCTAVGGVSESFVEGQTGFGVASDNPEELADKVSRLIEDRQLHRQLSQNAFHHTRSTFGIDKMISATLQAYADAEGISTTSGIAPEGGGPDENAGRERFAFGKNWQRFVRRNYSEQRGKIAREHILRFLQRETLEGLDFLDIGCGSGLHSLAALRSGAGRIHSFDYDSDSIVATRLVRQTAGDPPSWTVERGDVLDPQYIAKLGRWNLVYSWGVLHHTGDVWQAIRNAQSTVADGGLFYLALYSAVVETIERQEFWLATKQDYNRSGPWRRKLWEWWYIWNYYMDRRIWRFPDFLRRMAEHRFVRGMSLFSDLRDWLGGWPMQYTHDQDVVDLLEQQFGFKLINVATGQACSEFLFERSGKPHQRTIVNDMVLMKAMATQEAELKPGLRLKTLVLVRPFLHESGHLYKTHLPPRLARRSDSEKNPQLSPLRLREDGKPIGPAHSGHAEISNLGAGRYSHWGDTFYFSTSDNSDPNSNGRRYSVAYPASDGA